MKKAITLVLAAECTGEFGDSPDFAVIKDAHALLEQIRRIQGIVMLNELEEARVKASFIWGPESSSVDLALEADVLVVSPCAFWFTALPAHSSYRVQTRMVSIDALASELSSTTDETLFMGDDVESIKGYYFESEEASQATE
jgi:hypothetical protein